MGKRGFSLIELMIVALIVSALGLGLSIYLKRSSVQLRSNDQRESLRSQVQIAENLLKRELQQIVFINPACINNKPSGLEPTADCAGIKVRSGFTPYPGHSKEEMDTRVDLSLSSNLEADPASLSFESDAARIVVYDFDGGYHCPLDENVANNPAPSSFRIWASETCTGLELGRLYILTEEMNGQVFSNLFQITELTGGSGSAYRIDMNPGGLFNQSDPMSASLFSTKARIFPVKLVEYAIGNEGGLYRREIRPTSGNLSGYQEWTELLAEVEGLQFKMVTITTSEVHTHWRVMNFDNNDLNNGIEDIRGVSPRIVLKLNREDPNQQLYDNPLTSLIENDHFPRQETNFYINFKNTGSN